MIDEMLVKLLKYTGYGYKHCVHGCNCVGELHCYVKLAAKVHNHIFTSTFENGQTHFRFFWLWILIIRTIVQGQSEKITVQLVCFKILYSFTLPLDLNRYYSCGSVPQWCTHAVL